VFVRTASQRKRGNTRGCVCVCVCVAHVLYGIEQLSVFVYMRAREAGNGRSVGVRVLVLSVHTKLIFSILLPNKYY